ncbi:MAG: site-specific integrase [Cyanobacteria bacterium P01_A01_bin.37]
MPIDEPHPIDSKLIAVNHRLKVAQLGVQLERRGQKLGIRGTFPPRPGSHRIHPHQQRVSLGLPATPGGLKTAEQQAKVIAVQLMQHTFDWAAYLPIAGGGKLHQMNLKEKIEAFRRHFMAQPQRLLKPASAQATWETAYAPYFRKLEAIAQDIPNLSLAEVIYKTIESTPRHSRSRQICCTALGVLAEFLKVELPRDLKEFWGHYSPSKTRLRHLPTDEQIVEVYQRIPNPAWRFVYGIMATYGLRNHEVFFCDYSGLERLDSTSSIEVLDSTKTGEREVWPFYPEWVAEFKLHDVMLPRINTDLTHTTLQRIGQKVSAQLRRYDIPFNPYDLRHAWAVRTIHFGLSDTVSAQMMGHSVAIHTRTYHRWMTRRDQQQAVEAALNRSRLKAPSSRLDSVSQG